jgi:hypothetical protein
MRKQVPIRYTARDFESIKQELVDYSKRYYPDTFSDFNKSSFGSLILDTVSYAGDVLSFYLDYQFNESMLNTAVEFDNILKISKQLGYKYNPKSTAYGFVTLFLSVPAETDGFAPNISYAPILKQGTTFTSTGGQLFTLLQDVDFSNPLNEIVVANVDSTTGVPTSYAIKTFGIVQSGYLTQKLITVGDYQRFTKLDLQDSNVLEIISVIDQEGNEYYEVDNLSQDVVFRRIDNNNAQVDGVTSLLKPFPVPRRFVLDKTRTTTYLQFGYGSQEELTNESVVDPAQNVLQLHGRNYFTEQSFDPTNLIKTDKFGVSPSNTILTVTYRKGNPNFSNVAAGTITNVRNSTFVFPSITNTVSSIRASVRNSLEVINEEPLTGEVRLDAAEELRMNTMNYYASQNRAVSLLDYQSIIYSMPSTFGKIKRCTIFQDNNSFKRNLNIYVISENNNGNLVTANSIVKTNLKTWLSQYKMINDTVDILDAIIINFGIDFNITVDPFYDRSEILTKALVTLQLMFTNNKLDIGESISIAQIYNTLNKIDGVIDTTNVTVTQKFGNVYSDFLIDLNAMTTFDGNFINAPKNVIYEVKFPGSDIKGTVS